MTDTVYVANRGAVLKRTAFVSQVSRAFRITNTRRSPGCEVREARRCSDVFFIFFFVDSVLLTVFQYSMTFLVHYNNPVFL